MINVTIESYNGAKALMAEKHYTKIISLVDINSPVTSSGPNHLVLTVTDIVVMPERFNGPYINPKMIPVLPDISHVDAVLAHTADMVDGDSLLIHCAAGKSRSAAMAWAVLIQHGMTFEEAFHHVKAIRPQAIPNQLMVALIDQKFGFGNAMREFYTNWYSTQIGIENLTALF